MKKLRLIALAALLLGCPATDNQISRTLEGVGLTFVREDGPAILECREQEVGSRIIARTQSGYLKTVIVCCSGYVPSLDTCVVRY